jgi:hypothetical protein
MANGKLDPILAAEIKALIRQTIWEVLEGAEEHYVTPKELSQRVSFMPIEWIRRHWQLLPRESAVVTEQDGKVSETNPGYPLHKIMHMIQEGKFRDLKMPAKEL